MTPLVLLTVKIPICNLQNEPKGPTSNRHSSHIVFTPIIRLGGVDGSCFKTKPGISVFINTAPAAKLLSWQQHRHFKRKGRARALRFMFSTKKNEHTIPLFINAKILPLNFLYHKTLSELMHDVSSASAPINICNLFTKTTSVHAYNTRSSTSEKFYMKASRLEIQKNAFSRMAATLWNEIPSCL